MAIITYFTCNLDIMVGAAMGLCILMFIVRLVWDKISGI